MLTTTLALATHAMLMAAQRTARDALETVVALAIPRLLAAVTMHGADFMFSSDNINSCWACLHLTSISTPIRVAVAQQILCVPVSVAGASGWKMVGRTCARVSRRAQQITRMKLPQQSKLTSLASLALVTRIALACPVGTAAPRGALLHVLRFVSSVKLVGANWAHL
jgi:hypothetical protein